MKLKNYLILAFLILLVFLLELKEILFGSLAVHKGVSSSVNAVLAEDASFFIKKSKSSNVVQNITFKDNLEAPISKGDIIGSASYMLDGEVIKAINVVAERDVKKINLLNMTSNVYENWFNMLR